MDGWWWMDGYFVSSWDGRRKKIPDYGENYQCYIYIFGDWKCIVEYVLLCPMIRFVLWFYEHPRGMTDGRGFRRKSERDISPHYCIIIPSAVTNSGERERGEGGGSWKCLINWLIDSTSQLAPSNISIGSSSNSRHAPQTLSLTTLLHYSFPFYLGR